MFTRVRRPFSSSPSFLLCLSVFCAAPLEAARAAKVWFSNRSTESLKIEVVELPGAAAGGFENSYWQFAPGEHAYLGVNNRHVIAVNKAVLRVTSRLGATQFWSTNIDRDGDLACQFGPPEWNRHRAILQGAKIYVRNTGAALKHLRLTSVTDADAKVRAADYRFEVAANQQGYLQLNGQTLLATGLHYTVSDGAGETTASVDLANLDDDGDFVLSLGAASATARRRGNVVTQDEEKLQSALGKIIVAAVAHAVATADAEPTLANQLVQEIARAARREAISSAMEDVFPGLTLSERTVIVSVTCDALDDRFDANNAHSMRELIVRQLKAERPDLDDAVDVADVIAQVAIAARQQRR